MPIIKLIIDGGSMKPGPAIAQQIGPMGINMGKVIQEVNEATSGFKGMKVPVELDINSKTKNFTIRVFSPPVAELIKKEIEVEKASGQAGRNMVGNIAIEQAIAIAKTKMPNMLAKNIKSAVKLVVGSCVSLGVLVENKNAKEIESEIESGTYNKEIETEKTEVSPEKKQQLAKYFAEVKAKQEAEAKAAELAKAQEEATKTETVEVVPTATTEKKEEPKKEIKKK